MADPKKRLITVIDLKKPVSEMTEEEVADLTRHVVGQVRERVPKPARPARKS